MHPCAHVFVADLDAPEVAEADRHHLGRVLRLRAGEAVTVSDGAGRSRPCRVGASLALEVDGPVVESVRPRPAVVVAFALTKGHRPELVVQKLTEVGVDRIVPVAAARSVVRWDAEREHNHLARLREVARAAAMQSRRVWLPEVQTLHRFDDAVRLLGPDTAGLAHPGGQAPNLDRPALLVGPEGGWSPSELAAGLPTVDLGPTVLRAETAAMAAGILLCALRGGLVRPTSGGGSGSAESERSNT